MIKLLFPFRYPMKLDTLILGGISINICILSIHISTYIILAPFQLHNSFNIFPISSHLYFDAKAIFF